MYQVAIDKGYTSGRTARAGDGTPFFMPIAWFELPDAANDYAAMISEKLGCDAEVTETTPSEVWG